MNKQPIIDKQSGRERKKAPFKNVFVEVPDEVGNDFLGYKLPINSLNEKELKATLYHYTQLLKEAEKIIGNIYKITDKAQREGFTQ